MFLSKIFYSSRQCLSPQRCINEYWEPNVGGTGGYYPVINQHPIQRQYQNAWSLTVRETMFSFGRWKPQACDGSILFSKLKMKIKGSLNGNYMFLFIFVLTIHWHIKITLQPCTSTMPTNLLEVMLPGLSGGLEHKLDKAEGGSSKSH